MSAYDQVMAAPAVAHLNDDDGDGDIGVTTGGDLSTAFDVPDVVFSTFAGGNYARDGILRAVRGRDGARMWPTGDPGYRVNPGAGVAIADVDSSSPGPEIFTCAETVGGTGCCDGSAGPLLMISAGGALLRTFPAVLCGYAAPAIGDMDGDGTPEIAVRYQVVHADGMEVFSVASRLTTTPLTAGTHVTLADLDEDGDLELVGGNGAYRIDGSTLWERTDLLDGRPAVADLDMDGRPDVLVVAPESNMVYGLRGLDGVTLWGPVDVNQGHATGSPFGGGPPTIADFDADGRPEVGVAGGYGYVVLEGESGSAKWFRPTQDLSSAQTGSSVFDFDGDGAAEVVYNDEKRLRIYRGADGLSLFDVCGTTATLVEYPIIADIDGDGFAEILVVANDYGGQVCEGTTAGVHGLRLFGERAGNWVRTRQVWPQHTYHVTDIEDDGRVPRMERRNWEIEGLNNFRQNVQPGGELDAPNLVLSDVGFDGVRCLLESLLNFRVLNRGRAGAPAGIPIAVFTVDPSSVGATPVVTTATTVPLLPGASEGLSVVLPFSLTPDAPIPLWLVVNGGATRVETLHECRTDDNAAAVLLSCPPFA